MPLVNYSSDSSSSSSSADERPAKKARKLPPLPAAFRDLYATPVRASKEDDPILHGGRQRLIPHVEGNWPTHIYTEWSPTTSQRHCLRELISIYSPDNDDVQSLLTSDLGVPTPLHISLSQSLSLTGEQRESFTEELKSSIEKTGLESFEVTLSDAEWVSNSTRTRWFLVLHIQTVSDDALNKLLNAANRVASYFGQEMLYPERTMVQEGHGGSAEFKASTTIEEPARNDHVLPFRTFESFHISIAWMLSKPSSQEKMTIKNAEDADDLFSKLQIPIEAVKAKVGNNILTFPLKRPSVRRSSRS